MIVYYYADPEFAGSHWFEKCRAGMQTVCMKRRYSLMQLDTCEAEQTKQIIKNKNTPLILIGTSHHYMQPMVMKFVNHGIRTISINMIAEYAIPCSSAVVMDYERGIYLAIEYLNAAAKHMGRDGRIALFGINKQSYTDIQKKHAFIINRGSEEDIFYNEGSATLACETFMQNAKLYHSVICSCDIMALVLRDYFRQKGLAERVPMIMSFADMQSSVSDRSLVREKITTLTVDYEQMGFNAVMLARYLNKVDDPVSIIVKIIPQIIVGDSTFGFEDETLSKEIPVTKMSDDNFFCDDLVDEINNYLKLLHGMTSKDEAIIKMLMKKHTRADIAEKMFLSESTVYERMRVLCRIAGKKNVKELIDLISRYA